MTIKPIASTMGVSTVASAAEGTGYYRYGGDKPHVEPPPGLLPQNAKASKGRAERLARYSRLRLEGSTRAQAAKELGICPSTGHQYERDFQYQQQRGASS